MTEISCDDLTQIALILKRFCTTQSAQYAAYLDLKIAQARNEHPTNPRVIVRRESFADAPYIDFHIDKDAC